MWQLLRNQRVFLVEFLAMQLVLLASVGLPGSGTVRAFAATDADTIFSSYNKTYYVNTGANGFYKSDNGIGVTPGWWTFAEEIELAEDVYARARTASNSNLVATNLTAPDWQPWGGTINSNSLQIMLTNAAAYFRLYGQ